MDDEPDLSSGESLDLHERTQAFQRRLIIATLKKTKGVQNKAARLLGVKATTLNEMIKRLNIEPTDHHV